VNQNFVAETSGPAAVAGLPLANPKPSFLMAGSGDAAFLIPNDLVKAITDEPHLEHLGDGWWQSEPPIAQQAEFLFDPRSALGLGPAQLGTRRVIQLQTRPHAVGILVDRLPDLKVVTASHLRPAVIRGGILAGLAAIPRFAGVGSGGGLATEITVPVLHLPAILNSLPIDPRPTVDAERLPKFGWPPATQFPRLASSLPVDSEKRQILLFPAPADDRRGFEVSFGLSASQVLEIVLGNSLSPLPFAPKGIAGVLPWRGLPVTVVDLAFLFRLGPKGKFPPARVAIARSLRGDQIMGFAIEDQTALLDANLVHQRWQQPLPVAADLILGAYDVDGDLLIVPNCDGLFKV
jgi:chemotaxis signal transduction protein